MHKYAVIVAGGSGSRMGNPVPKQFLPILGKPALAYTLHAFLSSYADLEIILVAPDGHLNRAAAIIAGLAQPHRVRLIGGGNTRFQSVRNGLAKVKTEAVVFVHDGVRCLVSQPLIRKCYEQALISGSAIPAVAATESIRIAENGRYLSKERNDVRLIQTPQTFLSSILLPAFEQAERDSFTDEATVVEAYGGQVTLVEGEYRNIKITRPIDMIIAEKILEQREASF